jgi:hypothetical protein
MAETRILPVAETAFGLDDCMMQSEKLRGVEEWYENQYHLVLGETEDHDFMVTTCLIVFKGPPGGGYKLIESGVANFIALVMLPKSSRGKIFDNDYMSTGESPWQALDMDALQIVREEDRVVWSVAGREFVARPPYWDLSGSLKGVDLDLTMHSICPGFPYLGTFKDIEKNMSAGIDEFTQAQGTITVDGKKHEISHAGGLYEHVALPGWNDIEVVLPGGYKWLVGWSEDIQVFMFYMSGLNNYTGHVIVDGKSISFHGKEQVSVEERKIWTDPRNRMTTGCEWHIRLVSDEGELDATVASGGRHFGVNCYANGYMGRFQHLAMVNGSFTSADGRTIPLENMRMCVDDTVVFHALL